MLGAGATARSAVLALAELGVTTLTVRARDTEPGRRPAGVGARPGRRHPQRLRRRAGAVGHHPRRRRRVDAAGLRRARWRQPPCRPRTPASCSTSCTPGGRRRSPAPPRGAGMTVVSGLDMLVHQAAEQFRLFTGHDGAGRGDGRRRACGAGAGVTPVWVVVVAALVMGVVGHLTGRQLATGGYRIDEDEAEHAPGRNWWPRARDGGPRRAGGVVGRRPGWLGRAARLPALRVADRGAGLDRPRRAPAAGGPGRADGVVAGGAARRGLGRHLGPAVAGRARRCRGDGGGLPAARRAARRGSGRRRRAARAGHRGAARLAGRRRSSWWACWPGSSSAGWRPWPCSRCGGRGCAARSPTARRCAWGPGSAIGFTSRILTWLMGG